jgi:hypothetical protein
VQAQETSERRKTLAAERCGSNRAKSSQARNRRLRSDVARWQPFGRAKGTVREAHNENGNDGSAEA